MTTNFYWIVFSNFDSMLTVILRFFKENNQKNQHCYENGFFFTNPILNRLVRILSLQKFDVALN